MKDQQRFPPPLSKSSKSNEQQTPRFSFLLCCCTTNKGNSRKEKEGQAAASNMSIITTPQPIIAKMMTIKREAGDDSINENTAIKAAAAVLQQDESQKQRLNEARPDKLGSLKDLRQNAGKTQEIGLFQNPKRQNSLKFNGVRHMKTEVAQNSLDREDSIIGRVSSGLHNASIHLEACEDRDSFLYEASPDIKSKPGGGVNAEVNFKKLMKTVRMGDNGEEAECDIDEDFDNENFQEKNINNSFINKLKDFSTFNPSGNKGREKGPGSFLVIPQSNSRAGGRRGEVAEKTSTKGGSPANFLDHQNDPHNNQRCTTQQANHQSQVRVDTFHKLDVIVESPTLQKSDEESSPFKRLLQPPQDYTHISNREHSGKQVHSGRSNQKQFGINPHAIENPVNLSEDSTPREFENTKVVATVAPFNIIDATQSTSRRQQQEQPLGINGKPKMVVNVLNDEKGGKTSSSVNLITGDAETSHNINNEDSVNQFMNTPSIPHAPESLHLHMLPDSRTSQGSQMFKQNHSSTASSRPNITITVQNQQRQSKPLAIPDIGTDPRIQVQFFTSILHEKEKQLLKQIQYMAQLKSRLRHIQARDVKVKALLREARRDNADLNSQANSILATKLVGSSHQLKL